MKRGLCILILVLVPYLVFSKSSGLNIRKDKNLSPLVTELGPYSSDKVKGLFEERTKLIYSQFEPSFDPYVGTDSVPPICRKEKLPKQIEKESTNSTWRLLSVFASKHKEIGNCSEPSSLVKLQYLMLHCKKNQKVFIVKTFYSKDLAWLNQPMALCK